MGRYKHSSEICSTKKGSLTEKQWSGRPRKDAGCLIADIHSGNDEEEGDLDSVDKSIGRMGELVRQPTSVGLFCTIVKEKHMKSPKIRNLEITKADTLR